MRRTSPPPARSPAETLASPEFETLRIDRLTVRRSTCTVLVTVKLRVVGAITDAQKAAWKSAIEARWNNKVKFVCPDAACPGACATGYPISVEVLHVTAGEHYVINADSPPAAAGGRAGLGETTSMTGWGVDDTVDVTHEFGHMLSAPDEYFTTNDGPAASRPRGCRSRSTNPDRGPWAASAPE